MKQLTAKEYIKSLKSLHLILMVGPILFSFAAIFITNNVGYVPKLSSEINSITKIAAPIVAILALFVSSYVFKIKVDALQKNVNSSLEQKLKLYKSASLIRWAPLEGAMLFCTILLFLSGNYYYLIISFIMLVFYIMYTPSKEQILAHLQLSTTEQAVLEDEYAVIE